jgi:hypothetical protein
MELSSKPCKKFPHLLGLTSIAIPIFSAFQYFNIFYFGLLKSEAVVFIFGYCLTLIYCVFVFWYFKNILIRLLLISVYLGLLTSTPNSIATLIEPASFLIRPPVNSGAGVDYGYERVADTLGYLWMGLVCGGFVGCGLAIWIKSLRRIDLSRKVIIIPCAAGFLISLACINLFLYGIYWIGIILIGIAIFIMIAVTASYHTSFTDINPHDFWNK